MICYLNLSKCQFQRKLPKKWEGKFYFLVIYVLLSVTSVNIKTVTATVREITLKLDNFDQY